MYPKCDDCGQPNVLGHGCAEGEARTRRFDEAQNQAHQEGQRRRFQANTAVGNGRGRR